MDLHRNRLPRLADVTHVPLRQSNKRDSLFVYTLPTWTNQTLDEELCAYDAFFGEVSVLPADEKDDRKFLLPECFYAKVANLTSFRAQNIIMRGNTSEESDPLMRLPSTLLSLRLQNVDLVNPTSAGTSYAVSWSDLFDQYPSLTALYLDNVGLEASLPTTLPENLLIFSAKNNSLTGPIPSTLLASLNASADTVTLDLSGNKLTGTVPAGLLQPLNATADTLRVLYFAASGNQLSGEIPTELLNLVEMSSLYTLSIGLAENKLTGSLTSSHFSAVALNVFEAYFDFGGNLLSGTIPSDLFASAGNSLSGLSVRLNSNAFEGSVPNFWTSLSVENSTLRSAVFDLSSNRLTGVLPSTLAPASGFENLAQLTFQLGSNLLTGNVPAGLLALEFDPLASLTVGLEKNQLTGSIAPLQVNSNLDTLSLSLASNHFSGPLADNLLSSIPASFAELSLDISSNALAGELSGSIFTPYSANIEVLYRYLELNAANCSLTGEIPNNFIGKLRGLSLNVASNQFTGSVPSTLFAAHSNLNFVEFNAANNALQGDVALPAVDEWYWTSLYLSGNQLANISIDATVAYLEVLDVSYNTNATGTLPAILFTNESRLIEFNASHTAFAGAFPDVSGYTGAVIEKLDLSATLVNFCAVNRSLWLVPTLTSCDLSLTTAANCASMYPQLCNTTAPSRITTPPTQGPSSTPTSNGVRIADFPLKSISALLITFGILLM